MVPAEVVPGAVAMLANASSQAEHLLNELVARESIEFCIWSRHGASVAPSDDGQRESLDVDQRKRR